MATGMPYGLQAMLKEGHKHFSGVEEAVMKNIEACKELAHITKTSLGPNGALNMDNLAPAVLQCQQILVTAESTAVNICDTECSH